MSVHTANEGFPDGKESACSVRDLGSMPRLGRCPGGGMAIHSSILAWTIHMDRGAWLSPRGRKELDTTE